MNIKTMAIITMVSAMILGQTLAFAADDLHLCGTVEGVDRVKRIVSIDVRSESCFGYRDFILPMNKEMSTINNKQRICFEINSNQCEPGYVYRITQIEKE